MNAYRGVVIRGERRGTALGYPTANIACDDKDIDGVFAAEAEYEGISYPAAAFGDPSRGILEAHLLDFSEDMYDKEISVTLLKKLRESKQFAGDAELKAAIAVDIKAVREYFGL